MFPGLLAAGSLTARDRGHSVSNPYSKASKQLKDDSAVLPIVRYTTVVENVPHREGTANVQLLHEDDSSLQKKLLERYGYNAKDVKMFDTEPKVTMSHEIGSRVIIKRVHRTSLTEARDMEREIEVLAGVRDPTLLPLVETLELKHVIWTVKNYKVVRTVGDLVRENGPMSEIVLRSTLNQFLSGIASLFYAGFAHLRINDSTVCMDQEFQVTITDFQYCCIYGEGKDDTLYAKTQEKYSDDIYTAPEVFSSISYNARKAVIWSCGVLVYFMVTGQTEKLANLGHPSFDQFQSLSSNTTNDFPTELPSNPSSRRRSSINPRLVQYPQHRHNIPDYVRWTLPTMLVADPIRRTELIGIATRIPKDYSLKETRPLLELVWLDYKIHVGQFAGTLGVPMYSSSSAGSIYEGLESSATSLYSMASTLRNPFRGFMGKGHSRRVSEPVGAGGNGWGRYA